jgi:N-acetyl sugar amidotransferase
MTGYQICTSCVLDTSDPGISFDKNGVCDQCNRFYKQVRPRWHTDERGRASLERLAEKIREAGRGKDFDCIIGVSGGTDSSYLTHIAKTKLGLRPLVFHVDTGWNSQEAVNNIERLIDGLSLDLFTQVIDWEEMRDLQLAFFRAGVPHIDLPQDHAFMATLFNFASRHQIKHILSGGNLSTECIRNPLEFFYYGTDLRHIKDIHTRFGRRRLDTFPLSGVLRHRVFLRYLKGIRMVTPLDYLPYVKNDAVNELERTYGWQRLPQKHFESRFTKFYESYWLPTKFGFDTRRVQFSSLIVTEQMTRIEAMKRLREPSYDEATIRQEFEYVATKLGISANELREYHSAPNKSYRDYKTQRGLFMIGGKIMHSLKIDQRLEKR